MTCCQFLFWSIGKQQTLDVYIQAYQLILRLQKYLGSKLFSHYIFFCNQGFLSLLMYTCTLAVPPSKIYLVITCEH